MWQLFAPKLEKGQRVHGNVHGRFVTAIRLRDNTLRCIDSTCYHAGGPLGIGEIEDVNGEACIKCPWHAYPVSLVDGSKFYESLELDKQTKKLVPAGWRKKERAQRVHDIEERKGGEIWVRLNQSSDKYDSDEYAGSAVCAERVQQGDVTGQKKGRDGIMPSNTSSGQVFAEQRWKPCKVLKVDKDGTEGIRIKVQSGPTFKAKPYPMLMMNAADLFAHPYVVVRIGSIHRYYTPLISPHDDDNVLTLAIRLYGSGLVSASLSRLKPGDMIDVRKAGETDPPAANMKQLVLADFLPQKFRRALLIAAGSGVTPLLAVCHSILENTPDTVVTFICFDRTPDTVICRDILTAWAQHYKKRLIVVRAFSKKVAASVLPGEASIYTEQRCTPEFIKKFMFPKVQPGEEKILVSWCGPPKFIDHMEEDVLVKAGFSKDDCFFIPYVG
jgi:ferredoxin-NADP reductase/nitrite reductase/ring-hydroxylating ferredoxin subunit